jgi:hypothetical protein
MTTLSIAWDLSQQSTPKRSLLPNIKPIGLGTPLVESLTSYLNRLAAVLHINITTIIYHALYPTFAHNPRNGQRLPVQLNGSNISQLNRGVLSKISVVPEALEKATGQSNLKTLTLLPLSNFTQSFIRARKYKSWCPDCLSEWQKNGSVIYEPLIWMIRDINVCGIHRRALESVCPGCSCEVKFTNSAAHPGACSHCGGWLGKSTGQQKPRTVRSKNMARSILKYECAGRFIASLKPTIDSEEVDLTKSFVEYAKKQIDNDASEYGSGKEQSCSADPAWYYGLERPDLMMLNTIWAALSGPQ